MSARPSVRTYRKKSPADLLSREIQDMSSREACLTLIALLRGAGLCDYEFKGPAKDLWEKVNIFEHQVGGSARYQKQLEIWEASGQPAIGKPAYE